MSEEAKLFKKVDNNYIEITKEQLITELQKANEGLKENIENYVKIVLHDRKEIERLHSITKEVREYCLEKAKGRLERTLYDDILEILDKENI